MYNVGYVIIINIKTNNLLHLTNTVDYLSQCQRGLGCGDKHSVVDSDRNSAKRSTVNKQLYDVTNIMRRYFRAAGT